MEDLNNILKEDHEVKEEQLKKYLSGKSSQEEFHVVEKQMADSAFVNDAVEGLQSFSSSGRLDQYVDQLNKNLHDHLNAKKERRLKRRITELPWIVIAVVIIIVLCILAFIMVKMQHEKHPDKISLVIKHKVQIINIPNG